MAGYCANEKMLPLNEIDKQFLENNLLTDEDMHFDTASHNFDAVFDENNLLKFIDGDCEALKDIVGGDVNSENHVDMIDNSILNLLINDNSCPMDIKIEPLSPESSYTSSSPHFWQSEVDSSSSNHSTGPFDCQTEVIISETPPRTPPSSVDGRTSSPSSSDSSVFVPISSLPSPQIVENNVIRVQRTESSNVILKPQQSIKNQVNIQPKPLTNGRTPVRNGMCKSFVLTPEQFSMLTGDSLKIKPVVNGNIKASTLGSPILQPKTDIPNGMGKKIKNGNEVLRNSTSKHMHSVDLAALKRQQRMIKNRESACLSRKKKKEYLQKLETEIKDISTDNSKLQMENSYLKQRIFDLEKENETLKSSLRKLNEALNSKVSPKALKKTVGLMVVVFMLTLNLSSLSRLFEKNVYSNNLQSMAPQHIGRTLLWEDEVRLMEVKNKSSEYRRSNLSRSEKKSENYSEDWDSFINVTMCPPFINQTESLRLDNDLRGWVQRAEKKQQLKELSKNKIETKKSLPPLPKLQSWIKKNRLEKHDWMKEQADHGVMIYHNPRKVYEDFFDAIHRRDDTFYFVSFSGDHLLLPAVVQNRTLRPRISIVMPAMTLNDSMGAVNDHICMMQIDCEVMNTKLVYVKESVVPLHLRQKQNTTKSNLHKKTMRYSSHHKSKSLEELKFNDGT